MSGKTIDKNSLRNIDWLVSGHGLKRANECIKCGKCEEACPQHIKIREELEKVVEALEIKNMREKNKNLISNWIAIWQKKFVTLKKY